MTENDEYNEVKDNEQNQRTNKAIKSGTWYTISSVSVKAVLIITTPIFTRLMSTTDYGISATFSSWFTLLSVVCSLNLMYSVGRAKLDFPGKLDEFVGSVQLLALVFTLGVGLISCFFFKQVCSLLEMGSGLVIALYIYLLVYPAIQLTQAKFKYVYNYKGNIAIAVYTTLSTVAISLILVLLLKDQQALGKSLGAVISSVILAIGIWGLSLKRGWIKANYKYWKYALCISVPLILNSISLNILAQSDRIFITRFVGSHYTAIYSLAYNYAILINIILSAVNEAWLPWFHDTFFDGNTGLIRKNVKYLVVFGCWFGVGCIAIAPEAIALLGGSSYSEGVWAVPPVTIGIVCSFIYQQYEHIELHLKKTWYISVGTILAAVLNIVLNYIFVPKYGFVAAAYTTLFCYFVLMAIHHFVSRVILKIHLYDDKFMYIALAATCILAIIFMSLYNKFWLYRWLLIIAISLLYLILNRKMIMGVIQNFADKKKAK
ncbi:MAG: oligosaccharide flippase family protein [Oscillospiraceae bacterium]|nr:oligosaccharide flippase family protein [Oscillospiraceae bacterium]